MTVSKQRRNNIKEKEKAEKAKENNKTQLRWIRTWTARARSQILRQVTIEGQNLK